MKKNNILYFALGAVVGGAAGWFAHRLYIAATIDKRLEAIEQGRYDDILSGYERKDEAEVNPEKTNTGRENGILSQDEREKIKKQLQTNLKETTNYASMYSVSSAAETEHPVDSDEEIDEADYPEEEEEDEEDSEEIEATEAALDATFEHQKNKNKKPKIISYEALEELPAYIDKRDLYYYMRDGVLANDEEEELVPEDFIGDALTKYGFSDYDNDETEIYVMNYAYDVCYTVIKVQGAFADLKG